MGNDGTHKLSRNESSVSDSEAFSPSVTKPECDDQIRFNHSLSISEQAGWDQISQTLSLNLGSLESGNSKQNRIESSSYSGKEKCTGRCVEPSEDSAIRVEFGQVNSSSVVQSVGNSFIGSICNNGEQKDQSVLFMDRSSTSICGGCSINQLGQDVCLRISTNSIDCQSSGTFTESVSMHSNSDSSTLAKTILVSSVVEPVNSPSHSSSMQSGSSVTSKGENISSKSRNVKSDCMVGIDRQLSSRGFSKRTRQLLRASWRIGTQKDYKCKFRQFSNWCGNKDIDPYTASLTECANFLAFLYFDKNLAYKTINGYRSMLSAVLPPIDQCRIGQHPYIIRLLRGIFNERPPVKKLIPEWDLYLVLGCLQKSPFEPMKDASLKYTTWKTCFLIAITTFQRCSDIQSLQLGENFENVQKKGVTFIRTGLSKTDRPGHVKNSIYVPTFSHNKLLDPKRALLYYLRKTEINRKQDSVEKLKLFLGINKPHNAVSSQTISRWIVETIKLAYQMDKKKAPKVKGHSTRSIGPSWALFKGASLAQIMESADWSTESTFVKHYLKPVNMNYLNI